MQLDSNLYKYIEDKTQPIYIYNNSICYTTAFENDLMTVINALVNLEHALLTEKRVQ